MKVSPTPLFTIHQHPGGSPLLTEAEVQRSFRKLFAKEVVSETFDKAETLLEELRPESPLRHRLSVELEELRELKGVG